MIIYEEVLKEFQKKKVEYVIVGGIAVNLLGSLRSTADLDILVKMSDENLAKIIEILKRCGYRVKQHLDPERIADEKTREDWIKNKHLKAVNFYKKGGLREVDIIIESSVSYENAEKTAVKVKAGNITLPVISIDNLIKMKRETDRGIDGLDIQELRKIKKLGKKI